MSDKSLLIGVPLDDEGFLRRECPFCSRQFKILLEKHEIELYTNNFLSAFLSSEEEEEANENDENQTDYFCPYCEQFEPFNSWWTQEQTNYFMIFAENHAADLINNFVDSLSSSFKSNSIMQFTANKMPKKVPWISPEENDMKEFNLQCCDKKIKLLDGWTSIIHCHFCGFPHENK